MTKVLRIERLGSGLRVTLSNGAVATYADVAALPADVADGLLSRMDAAADPAGASGGRGGASGGPGDLSAVDRYRQRLQNAHERSQADPHQGLTGQKLYEARLRDAWQQGSRERHQPNLWKHWTGA